MLEELWQAAHDRIAQLVEQKQYFAASPEVSVNKTHVDFIAAIVTLCESYLKAVGEVDSLKPDTFVDTILVLHCKSCSSAVLTLTDFFSQQSCLKSPTVQRFNNVSLPCARLYFYVSMPMTKRFNLLCNTRSPTF